MLPWYTNNLALYYCLNEVYRWGLIVALLIATVFLPFVVMVHAITSKINARKQVLQQSLKIPFYLPSGFVPDIQNVVQASNGHL